jgi:hypothetical protein
MAVSLRAWLFVAHSIQAFPLGKVGLPPAREGGDSTGHILKARRETIMLAAIECVQFE